MNSRRELVEQRGEYFKQKCTNCGVEQEFHVNDTKGQPSFLKLFIHLILGLGVIGFMTLLFWNRGYITSAGIVLGSLILGKGGLQARGSSENIYNSYRVPSSRLDD